LRYPPFSLGMSLPEDFIKQSTNMSKSQLIVPSITDLHSFVEMTKSHENIKFSIVTEYGKTQVVLHSIDKKELAEGSAKVERDFYNDPKLMKKIMLKGPSFEETISSINSIQSVYTLLFTSF
jgi:hypothetical protein